MITRVMLVCRQNSRRSQIAHGLLAARAPQVVEVCSAGLNGAGGLAPEAIAVMEEWDVADPRAGDLASHRHARDVIAARVEGLLLELGRD